MADIDIVKDAVSPIVRILEIPFWNRGEFWVSAVLSLIGIILSGFGLSAALKARDEAKSAKIAAQEAGSAVKIQTVVAELSELAQKLDKLELSIDYASARDMLNEMSRKIRRLVLPYAKNSEVATPVSELVKALVDAQSALKGVQPNLTMRQSDDMPSGIAIGSQGTQNSVYYAIDSHFMNISGLVGNLIGLFEGMNIPHAGENHGGQ